MRVAIVEDEGDIAHLYDEILTAAGHDVSRVDQHDLDSISDPDVVVLDLMMPDVDGAEVLTWLRGNRPGVRIVVASAMYQIPDHVRAMADVVITKPMTPDALLAGVEAP